MDYSTVLQVPSSKDSRLLRALSRVEPGLAKTTNFHVKLVEKSGRPLSKMFQTDFSDGRCGRESCLVCTNPDLKGPSMCMVSNVVYESVCSICDDKHKIDKSPHEGRYIGETSRTLFERATEHHALLNNLDVTSFMYKHWVVVHKDLESPPKFKFRVVKKHVDPLSRLIHEAVRILSSATMNSKSEWGGFKITRLTVEPPEWQKKKITAAECKREKVENEALLQFKESKLNCPNSKDYACRDYRKRKVEMSSLQCNQVSQPGAKCKRVDSEPKTEPKNSNVSLAMLKTSTPTMVSTKNGKWQPRNSKPKKVKVPKVSKGDSVSGAKLRGWLKVGPSKTSTPVKPAKICDETFVIDACDPATPSGSSEVKNTLESDTSVNKPSPSPTTSVEADKFDSTSSSMLEAVTEAYSLNMANSTNSQSSKVSFTFGSSNSSDDRALNSALDRSNISAVIPRILHPILMSTDGFDLVEAMNLKSFARNDEIVASDSSIEASAMNESDKCHAQTSKFYASLLCSDESDQVEAMNMEISTRFKDGFARDEEKEKTLADNTGTNSLVSNVLARDPVVIGQGLDLLLESLGPGEKLGPLAATVEANGEVPPCSASDDENAVLPQPSASNTAPIKKCEVSAMIWDRMVKNAEGNRCSFKRPSSDQLQRLEFEDVMKKMRTVSVVDYSCVAPTSNAVHAPNVIPCSPAVTKDGSRMTEPRPALPSAKAQGIMSDNSNLSALKCGSCDLADRCDAKEALDKPQMDEIGVADKSKRCQCACIASPMHRIAPALGPTCVDQCVLADSSDVVLTNQS